MKTGQMITVPESPFYYAKTGQNPQHAVSKREQVHFSCLDKLAIICPGFNM